MGMRGRKSSKSPPVFSHEFVIQNHADITSCVAMVFVIGLMFQATSPVASLFVTLQHNITVNATDSTEPLFLFTCGLKDIFTTFFYLLICIIAHAVVQEYVLDKLNRKMHLSKVKHSKFNESGQLMTFYFASAVWGADTIIREGFHNINQLWEGYPTSHANMTFIVKFYFLVQLAYWLHCFPELYFQKIKKEEMKGRITYCMLYLIFIAGAYAMNFTRVAMLMLVLHYLVEFVFHLARLIYFADKQEMAGHCFMVFDVLFVLVRLGSITLAVLTFWYGLQQSSQDSIDIATGNFNTKIFRIYCLLATCLLQAWMMWNFLTFQLRRLRERTVYTRKLRSPTKKKGKVQEEDISSLPEVDQNTAQNGLRPRKVKK
ncbi:translocating chain-associated membrane protein 1-like isoform X1 [Mya arenaria]|nr:translocating chain-associated membrane protein 1-like isoform X1 [Mya arenaria]